MRGTGVLLLIALSVYVNTESFQALVRRRLVAEIERITGGRAEIGSIHTVPFLLQVDVRNITVHGRESATDVPLAHVDSMLARLKVSSLLRSEFAFHEVMFDQPVIHVAFYPDGATNFPPRKARKAPARAAVERLFALSVNRLEVRQGRIFWDDQTIPLDFSARDAVAANGLFLSSRPIRLAPSFGMVETKLLRVPTVCVDGCRGVHPVSGSAVVYFFKWNSGHSMSRPMARSQTFAIHIFRVPTMPRSISLKPRQ